MSDPQTPLYHVQFRQKNGTYLGLHFVNGVSREVVDGPKDPMLRKIRAIFGSASFNLLPAEQGAVVPPPPIPNPPVAIPQEHRPAPAKADESAPVTAAPPPPADPPPDPPPAAAPKAKPWAERMKEAKEAKAAKAKAGDSK